jgi:TP901 family phage tail tape measure protein
MPTGFAQFDAAMKRSAAQAAAYEKGVIGSQQRVSRASMAAGVAATGSALGIAAIGVAAAASVSKSMAFNKQLSELKAVTKASAVDMKRMSDAALQLGAKTGVGATKAAQAMTELAKGGLDTEKTIGALKGTIALAQAGSMDLGIAAETVANSLNLFKLSGEDATMVADSFANAANATTADVAFFSQGMAQGGAAAKAAGLDFQQTTVFLEAMAANGFKSGSDAGTAMKTTLIQLAKPTAQAQAALADKAPACAEPGAFSRERNRARLDRAHLAGAAAV